MAGVDGSPVAKLRAEAHALGHRVLVVNPGVRVAGKRRKKYWAHCKCGYDSTSRNTMALAVEAGWHHMVKAVKEHRASGAAAPVPVSGQSACPAENVGP